MRQTTQATENPAAPPTSRHLHMLLSVAHPRHLLAGSYELQAKAKATSVSRCESLWF